MTTQANLTAARRSPPPNTESGTYPRVDETALMLALADPFTTWQEAMSFAATTKKNQEHDEP